MGIAVRCAVVWAVVLGVAFAQPPYRGGFRPNSPPRERPAGIPGRLPEGAPGPWDNDVVVYRVSPAGVATQITTFERAGVATVARMKDGRLIAAHQHFPQNDDAGFDKVAIRMSLDEGKVWTAPTVIRLAGLPEGMRFPFDPTLVVVPDGRVRLYFTSLRGRRFEEDVPAIYSAISDNGVDYTVEPGMRFGIPGRIVIDCAVVLHQGVFHLYAPDNGPQRRPRPGRGPEPADGGAREGVGYHATSEDGLKFTRANDVRIEGRRRWLGNAVSDGKKITFFGTGDPGQPGFARGGSPGGGVWTAVSSDGDTWRLVAAPQIGVADPGAVALKDGGWVVVGTGPPRGRTNGAKPRPRFADPPDASPRSPDARAARGEMTFAINTHDWGRVDHSADTVLRLIELFAKYKVRGEFYVTAPVVEAYARSRPEVVARLRESGMTISYHYRPPHPGYQGFEAALRRLDEASLRATLKDYETYRLDLATGGLDRARPGGYRYVQQALGTSPVVVSALGPPWVRAALRDIYRDMGAQMTVEYHESGTLADEPFVWRQGLLIRPSDFSITRWAVPGGAGEEFWWNRIGRSPTDQFNPTAQLTRRLAAWPHPRSPLITALIHENDFYVRGGPSWNAVYFGGEGRRPRTDPYDLAAPDRAEPRSADDQASIWRAYEELVAYAAKELRVVTSADIIRMAKGQRTPES